MSVEILQSVTTNPSESGRTPQSVNADSGDAPMSFGAVLAGRKTAQGASSESTPDTARSQQTSAARTASRGTDGDPGDAITRQRELVDTHRQLKSAAAAHVQQPRQAADRPAALDSETIAPDAADTSNTPDQAVSDDTRTGVANIAELPLPVTLQHTPSHGPDVASSAAVQTTTANPQTPNLAMNTLAQAPTDARQTALIPTVETARAGQAAKIDMAAAQGRGRSEATLAASAARSNHTGNQVPISLDALSPQTGANDEVARLAPVADRLFAAQGERFKPVEGRPGASASGADIPSVPGVATHGTPAAAGANVLAATAAPALAATVNAPLGSEAWKQAINQQALRLSHFGDGSAELTLYPRELGQLHVSLKMGEKTQLHFVSAHADVRAAVEAAMPQLRHAFADNGINLGQASVSDQGPGTGHSPNSNSDSSGAGAGNGAIATGDGLASDGDAIPVAVTTLAGRTRDGGIDIFA